MGCAASTADRRPRYTVRVISYTPESCGLCGEPVASATIQHRCGHRFHVACVDAFIAGGVDAPGCPRCGALDATPDAAATADVPQAAGEAAAERAEKKKPSSPSLSLGLQRRGPTIRIRGAVSGDLGRREAVPAQQNTHESSAAAGSLSLHHPYLPARPR